MNDCPLVSIIVNVPGISSNNFPLHLFEKLSFIAIIQGVPKLHIKTLRGSKTYCSKQFLIRKLVFKSIYLV